MKYKLTIELDMPHKDSAEEFLNHIEAIIWPDWKEDDEAWIKGEVE